MSYKYHDIKEEMRNGEAPLTNGLFCFISVIVGLTAAIVVLIAGC